MQQRVPHELEEVILGNLRSDTSTLKACSLACHRFASVSQKLLFDNVVLDFSASPKRVYAPSPTSPQRFPTLLESSPHISELIHSVDIIANSYLLQSLDAILLPCLPQLVNLRSISLDTISARPIYWRYLSADMRRALRTAFHSKHIVNIRLRRVFEVPLSLLAECTTLEGLSLSSITFRQEDVSVGRWEAPLLKRRPQLKSLHLSISNEVYQGFLKWLLGRTCTLDISKLLLLSISIFSENFDYGNIDKLLQATRSLEVLCLSPFVPEYQGLYSAAELPNPSISAHYPVFASSASGLSARKFPKPCAAASDIKYSVSSSSSIRPNPSRRYQSNPVCSRSLKEGYITATCPRGRK
ncbi:hypothetical protein BDZ97DRAFT_89343 [Flammula alnicola]|nr:hypothetical protein BDZ97DRAFT_89343 [Flammula alnicola]